MRVALLLFVTRVRSDMHFYSDKLRPLEELELWDVWYTRNTPPPSEVSAIHGDAKVWLINHPFLSFLM